MGGNRLPFAVRVRRQVDGICPFGHLLQLGDDLFFTWNNFIFRRELVLQVDPKGLLGQVLDVPHRGLHLEALLLDISGSSSPSWAIRR